MASAPAEAGQQPASSRLRQFLTREDQSHGFTTDAFVERELGVADPFPVTHLFFPVGWWRVVTLVRFILQIQFALLLLLPGFYTQILILLAVLLLVPKIISKVLQKKSGLGDGSLGWIWLKSILLTVRALGC